MMRRFTKNVSAWITISTIISFFLMYAITTQEQAIEIANGLVLGVGVAIMLTWFVPAIQSMRSNRGTGAGLLSMAIFGLGLAMTLHRLWAYAVRWSGRPEWMLDSIFNPGSVWILGVAGVMILLAPGTQEGEIPLRNYVWFVFAGVIGALVSGISIGFSLANLPQ